MNELTNRSTTRTTRRLRLYPMLVAAATLPLVFLPGCKKDAPPPVEVTVQAEHPEQGPISEQISADAILAPVAQAAIAPKISAPIKKFYVERGQRVHAGELLATLENTDLVAAAMDNKGSLDAAQANYDTSTKAQVPEDTLKAESDLAQAKANLDLNKSIVESRKQLFAEGAIPGRDLDTAEAALVQAQAIYDAALRHLESVRKVSRDATQSRAGTTHLCRGQIQRRSGASRLLRNSQPHQWSCNGPALVRG